MLGSATYTSTDCIGPPTLKLCLMYLGLNSARVISQACLAALMCVGVDGCKDCATQTSWFGATMQLVEGPWHA